MIESLKNHDRHMFYSCGQDQLPIYQHPLIVQLLFYCTLKLKQIRSNTQPQRNETIHFAKEVEENQASR